MRNTRLGIVTLVILCAACEIAQSAPNLQPRRAGQEAFLKRAIFADHRLWLVSDSGELSTIAPEAERRTTEILSDRVLDVCKLRGEPQIVACATDECDEWTIKQEHSGSWQLVTTVSGSEDAFAGMACANGATYLVTSKRLLKWSAGSLEAIELSSNPTHGLLSALVAVNGSIFVGSNAGEWGGGLRKIDASTGRVTLLQQIDPNESSSGPLNANLDPVTGLAEFPKGSGCIVAAIGLVHMLSHGRLVQICGSNVKEFYSDEYEIAFGDRMVPISAALFGAVVRENSLWTAGNGKLYKVDASGTAEKMEMPKFRNVDGIYVSFGIPDLPMVLTRINQRHSVSGSVPMLVPR